MADYTDSVTIVHNDDGSQTITSVERYTPPTKGQQTAGFVLIGLITFAPVIVMGAMAAADSWWERREAKKHLKRQAS